jgi:hypothetical protein
VSAIDESIRAIVRDELRALGVTAREPTVDREHLEGTGYTSGEAWTAKARKVLDPKYKTGRGWACPLSVWRAAVAADRARRCGPTATPPMDPIDRMLESSGLRLVKSGGRP